MQSHFSPGELWPDTNGTPINAHGGGILHHQGIYYWFGEHKLEGTAGNKALVGVHVYSSRDLYNWKDEGIALPVSDDPESDITKGCILERPKVIHNRTTGKFVMWFHLELKQTGYASARSGVAVADHPTGPYQFIKSFRPNAGIWPQNVPDDQKKFLSREELAYVENLGMVGGPVPDYPKDLVFRRDYIGGQMARDMTIFVDDDGNAYHIHASEDNGALHISQLSDDYLSPRGRYSRFFPGRFHEAPTIMKRKGVYFLITSDCTSWAPNAARLSRGETIWGPWTELGNPCVGTADQIANTFESQSTHILTVADNPDSFIFMADRWRPKNAIDGRYVWLPIQFKDEVPFLTWEAQWDLGFFNKTQP
jgi:beta-xylosidase